MSHHFAHHRAIDAKPVAQRPFDHAIPRSEMPLNDGASEFFQHRFPQRFDVALDLWIGHGGGGDNECERRAPENRPWAREDGVRYPMLLKNPFFLSLWDRRHHTVSAAGRFYRMAGADFHGYRKLRKADFHSKILS